MRADMNATEKLIALKRCEVLAAADADALDWLSEAAETEGFEAGEVVFENGDVSARVYVVVSGTLEVRRSEDTAMVGLFEPGALFGEYAMFVNGVRTARVVARDQCVLLSIDDEDFRAFLLRSPAVLMLLLQTSVRRLNRASRHR